MEWVFARQSDYYLFGGILGRHAELVFAHCTVALKERRCTSSLFSQGTNIGKLTRTAFLEDRPIEFLHDLIGGRNGP